MVQLKVLVVGLATLDTLLFVQPLGDAVQPSKDELVSVTDVVVSAGGKGIVASIAFQYLGVTSSTVCQVGVSSDFGDYLPTGFDVSNFLAVLAHDNQVWLAIDRNQSTRTYLQFPRRVDGGLLGEKLSGVLEGFDLVYLSSEATDILEAILNGMRGKRLDLFVNLTSPLLFASTAAKSSLVARLARRARALIMNHDESSHALRVLGRKTWSNMTGPQEIVITNGAAGGSWAIFPFESWNPFSSVEYGPTQCVAGAGDTFSAAYIAARVRDGASVAASCDFAADIAGRKVAARNSSLWLPRSGGRGARWSPV